MVAEPITIGRESFYATVWSEPMSRIALRYGVSDVALAKICRKMDIPHPPVGFWQRKKAGYNITQPPLPPLKRGVPETVTLTGQPSAEGPAGEAARRIVEEKSEENRITVPTRLATPHNLIRHTVDALERSKPDERGLVSSWGSEGCLPIQVSRGSAPRAVRILNALIKAIEQRGFAVKCEEMKVGMRNRSGAEILGEEIQFLVEEVVQRSDHVLTQAEEGYKRSHSWSSAPKYDYAVTGMLRIRINERTDNRMRKVWADGRRRRLEDSLNDVMRGLIAVADAKRRDRKDREEREKQWRIEAERRAEAERQRLAAERLKQELLQLAASWVTSQNIRAFITAAERAASERNGSIAPGSQTHRWLEWARRQADELDPLGGTPTVIPPSMRH
jgi:hypothetical protein